MNTTNVLLGTTSLLIVVAFALSFQGFSKNRNSPDSKKEIELLEDEMAKIAAERRALELAQLRANAIIPEPTVETIAVAPTTEVTELTDDERQELEDKIADLEKENEKREEELEEFYDERRKIKEEQMMAAKRVDMALDMGTVISANKEHAIVIFKPTPEAPTHQPGMILSVRRNSGILGEIQVDRLDSNGHYVATMRPQVFAPDGYPDILPGDTIILDPNK